jgi:putative nucleotidyltransferase with HDIG domain
LTDMVKPEVVREHLLGHIIDEDLRGKAAKVLDDVWDVFHKIPASKTGKYHPVECNRAPYGLVNHTLRVVLLCEALCREEDLDEQATDAVVTAAVIHDVGKVNFHIYPDRSCDHGEVGALMALNAGLPKDIADMVARHMGHWEGKRLVTVQDRILAWADYIASRSYIRFDTPGAMVTEE